MTKSKFKRKVYSIERLEIVGLSFEVQRKKIKRLYLKIDNKNAQLKIIAPLNYSEKFITNFITEKKSWIIENQQKVLLKINSYKLDFIDGAGVKLLGENYSLKLLFNAKKPKIYLIKTENLINNSYQQDLFNSPENFNKDRAINHIIIDSIVILNEAQKKKLIENFYRTELQKIITELTPQIQTMMQVQANFIGIKKMRTRYGSCNARTKNIWLSLNLIHYPLNFIRYVLVHEFSHFFQQNHGKKFYALMDRFLPEWRSIRKLNNTAQL